MGYLEPKEIEVYRFSSIDPFRGLEDSRQLRYLRTYLSDLSAKTVVEEPNYFDRDYLSEFSAFYSMSAHGYPSICRRLHFFDQAFTRAVLTNALGGTKSSLSRLRRSYLGFVIVRPIPASPLGRTVLKWYPEQTPGTPRVSEASRQYTSHLAGIKLSVDGLAWQQQDTGVGACATVGLWTMLHSSAFDPRHAIPTTTAITLAAHKNSSLGTRVFPSTGLTLQQICEATKNLGLAPGISDGDVRIGTAVYGFSRERFASSCAAYIRSGYPVLLVGVRGEEKHAICVVGIRSHPQTPLPAGTVGLEDSTISVIYVHDDNIGPNVRFRIRRQNTAAGQVVSLVPEAPKPHVSNPPYTRVKFNLQPFVPHHMLVAVHDDVRTSPDTMHRVGLENVGAMSLLLSRMAAPSAGVGGLTFSTRFIRLSDYLGAEIEHLLGDDPALMARVRFELCEEVLPMSLHLGLVRVALDDSTPLLDILYDTTDSDRNHPVFAHVAYSEAGRILLSVWSSTSGKIFGKTVRAY